MRARGLVAGVAALSLLCGLVWLAQRAPDAVEEPVDRAPAPVHEEISRADTRVARQPHDAPAAIHGAVVRGRFETPDAGRDVELLRDGRVVAHTLTDGVGAFAFRSVVPRQAHEVRVAADGCQTVRVPGLTLVPGERRDVGELLLDEPRVVPVLVTDESGAPVPGAIVEIYREPQGALSDYECFRAAPGPVPLERAAVDEQGKAELRWGYNAWHTAVAHAPGHGRVAEALVEMILGEGDGTLRLVLPPAHALRGTVTDAAGAPAAGAVVFARRRPRVWDLYHGTRAESAALWHETTTDASGAFAFDGLPPGTIDLHCGRAGGLPGAQTSVEVPAIAEVRLTLADPVAFAGRTTVHGTDDPLPGVLVACRTEWFATTTVTDADGRWGFADVPPDRIAHVDLDPPRGWSGPLERGGSLVPSGEFGGRFQEILRAGETRVIDTTFERAATLEGVVTVDGAPVAGAWVRATTLGGPEQRGGQAQGRSGADGRYRLDDVVPGAVVVLAVPPDVRSGDTWSAFGDLWKERYPTAEAQAGAALDLAAGSVTRLDLAAALPEGFEPWSARSERMDAEFDESSGVRRVAVRGRITTADGLPLREVKIKAGEGEAEESPDIRDDFEPWNLLPVSPDGTYEGEVRVYPDTERLHVSAFDARHDVVSREVRLTPEMWTEGVTLDVALPPLPLLRGRVEHAGRPVAGAEIHVGGALAARTASDGTFAIPFRPGAYPPGVRAAGFLDALVEDDDFDAPPSAPLVIELERAHTLAGRIVDTAGQPVAGLTIVPVDEDDDRVGDYRGVGFFRQQPGAETDSRGAFRVEGIPPGEVYLRVAPAERGAGGTARFTAGPFTAGADDVVVVAATPRRLTGRVVDPDGNALDGVRIVCIALEDALAAGGGDRKARTAVDGTFVLDDLLVAAYAISALPDADTGLQPTEVEIAPEQEHVEIALEHGAVIAGVARWADGSPFAPDLQLRPLDPVPPGQSSWDLRIDVADDGRFRAVVCKGVRYAIELYRGDWSDAVVLTGGETVVAGSTGVVITAVRVMDEIVPEDREAGIVAGTIVTTGGDPVPGAQVVVFTSEGSRETTTGANGAFSVSGLRPGAEIATASVVARAAGRCSLQVDDVKIGTNDVRVAMKPERTIAGKLLDAAGAPATGWRVRALDPAHPEHDLWRAELDAEGRFVLAGLARGTWLLQAIVERNDGIHRIVDLGAARGGAQDLELRLP